MRGDWNSKTEEYESFVLPGYRLKKERLEFGVEAVIYQGAVPYLKFSTLQEARKQFNKMKKAYLERAND